MTSSILTLLATWGVIDRRSRRRSYHVLRRSKTFTRTISSWHAVSFLIILYLDLTMRLFILFIYLFSYYFSLSLLFILYYFYYYFWYHLISLFLYHYYYYFCKQNHAKDNHVFIQQVVFNHSTGKHVKSFTRLQFTMNRYPKTNIIHEDYTAFYWIWSNNLGKSSAILSVWPFCLQQSAKHSLNTKTRLVNLPFVNTLCNIPHAVNSSGNHSISLMSTT